MSLIGLVDDWIRKQKSVPSSSDAVPHDGIVITKFREWRGSYEYQKAQALAKHLRTMADIVANAQSVKKCPLAPERDWISVQEWVTSYGGLREGQWQSDIEVVKLP